jgi:hypothetical protein
MEIEVSEHVPRLEKIGDKCMQSVCLKVGNYFLDPGLREKVLLRWILKN